MFTLRDVEPHEELCFDYNGVDADRVVCVCSFAVCNFCLILVHRIQRRLVQCMLTANVGQPNARVMFGSSYRILIAFPPWNFILRL